MIKLTWDIIFLIYYYLILSLKYSYNHKSINIYSYQIKKCSIGGRDSKMMEGGVRRAVDDDSAHNDKGYSSV